jgi:hypothetical protein
MSTVVPLIDDTKSTSETADVIPASDSAAPTTLEEPEAAAIPAPAPATSEGGRRHRKSHHRKSRKNRRSKSRHRKSRHRKSRHHKSRRH